MKYTGITLALVLGTCVSAWAAEPQIKVEPGKDSFRAAGRFFVMEFSNQGPRFTALQVDSLGRAKFQPSALRPPPPTPQKSIGVAEGSKLEYRHEGAPASSPARWTFEFAEQSIRMIAQFSEADPPEPLTLDFDLHRCHATLLGRMGDDGRMRLPALLHLPDQGTFRVTSSLADAKLPYDARRTIGPYVKVSFPPATRDNPRVEYRWEATAVYPQLKGIENDPRFDGFRRNWLNSLQVNPQLGALANNSASDICASCAYEYSDICLHTPPLADSLDAIDLVGQLLAFYTSGKPGYGLPGWVPFDFGVGPEWAEAHKHHPIFLDAYPNLLIAATDYVASGRDKGWLKNNYAAVRGWAEALLAMDRDGNGLFEYGMSGNSGSWSPSLDTRPANWWDTIGFGHEDAYSNALAYRGLRGMEQMAGHLDKTEDAARYRKAADRVREAYLKTFYNPATGVLAGWRSADGELHDYYFLFVNGLAIHYGLVPKQRANAVVDKLLAKMKEVGYTRFDLGLPGNLTPVPRCDYVDNNPRFGGGGNKPDNSDVFQRYENGGATACHAFHFLAAMYDLGRRKEADRILMPMLDGFEKGGFQGLGANGMSNDWRAWDGTPWGYEGFLTDNYYALLAVVAREGALKKSPIPYGPQD